jgi:hypothetical protein
MNSHHHHHHQWPYSPMWAWPPLLQFHNQFNDIRYDSPDEWSVRSISTNNLKMVAQLTPSTLRLLSTSDKVQHNISVTSFGCTYYCEPALRSVQWRPHPSPPYSTRLWKRRWADRCNSNNTVSCLHTHIWSTQLMTMMSNHLIRSLLNNEFNLLKPNEWQKRKSAEEQQWDERHCI